MRAVGSCASLFTKIFALATFDLEIAVVGCFRGCRRNLRLIELRFFSDLAQLNRPGLFHRLPHGIRSFVEQDFVGHGGMCLERGRSHGVRD